MKIGFKKSLPWTQFLYLYGTFSSIATRVFPMLLSTNDSILLFSEKQLNNHIIAIIYKPNCK